MRTGHTDVKTIREEDALEADDGVSALSGRDGRSIEDCDCSFLLSASSVADAELMAKRPFPSATDASCPKICVTW